MNKSIYAIGLMSGTSLDGIDAALLKTDGIKIEEFGATFFLPYEETFRNKLKACLGKIPNHPLVTEVEQELTNHHAKCVKSLLKDAKLSHSDVGVVGFHGQSVLHLPPRAKGETGKTYQIGDGQHLANLIQIPVINQFRQNDMKHGGQGAPLVPIYHWALSQPLIKPIVILNIGGVANVTWIGERDQPNLLAFDTGPGNAMIDDWMWHKAGLPFDQDGRVAAEGKVNQSILERWLALDYFKSAPPKALDRNAFNTAVLDDPTLQSLSLKDGAATLTAFTAHSIAGAQVHFPAQAKRWVVAGGGAHNKTLIRLLSQILAEKGQELLSANQLGWNVNMLEAQAFAYLAVRSLYNLPLSFPTTTGVRYPVSGGEPYFPLH